MVQPLQPAGIRALAIVIPTDTREITLPDGQSALRHFLPEGVSGLDLEKEVATKTLAAANLDPSEVDLVISASFPALPEPCIGNATPMAWDLGMEKAAAYNIESACAGGLLALRTACQEVSLGNYKNVLVTVGCPYSHTIEPGHPALDVIGDAAFGLLVGPTRQGEEFLGSYIRNSGPTCPLVSWGVSPTTPSGIRLEVNGKTAGQLEKWAHQQLPELCDQLFEHTGLSRDDVQHWVVNFPTISFVDKAVHVMGGRPEDTVNCNRLAGNIGPALSGVSLFYNALLRGFKPGDLVLCCSVGSESSLALSLMRWPNGVAFGDVPDHASLEMMKVYEKERLSVPV